MKKAEGCNGNKFRKLILYLWPFVIANAVYFSVFFWHKYIYFEELAFYLFPFYLCVLVSVKLKK